MDVTDIIIIVLSSSVVSGLVTIVLGSVFENKRYIKDKKISIYTGFLEQLENVFPAEEIFTWVTSKKLTEKMNIEIAKLERYVWKIKLISQNKNIQTKADKVFSSLEKIAELFVSSKTSSKKILSAIDKSNALRDELIREMNNDIARWY